MSHKITVYLDGGDDSAVGAFVAVIERIARLIGFTNIESTQEYEND